MLASVFVFDFAFVRVRVCGVGECKCECVRTCARALVLVCSVFFVRVFAELQVNRGTMMFFLQQVCGALVLPHATKLRPAVPDQPCVPCWAWFPVRLCVLYSLHKSRLENPLQD